MAPKEELTIVSLLGSTLLSIGGEEVLTEEVMKDAEVVCLYFSASWCPPCRSFTPILTNFYNTIGASEHVKVIFVSSDNDHSSFEQYFGKMSYNAIPFGSKNVINQLNSLFKIQGIPTLVVLDAKTLNYITNDGRGDVAGTGDGTNESKAKSVVHKWKSTEAVPIEEAKLGGGGCAIS